MNEFESIRQTTAEAIRSAALEAYQTIPKGSLVGFGICTHDDAGLVACEILLQNKLVLQQVCAC